MTLFSSSNVRMWSMLGSAGTFGSSANLLPEVNDKSFVITSDLRNFSGLDRFASKFPGRFLNVGIAEQNMVGVAAGLSAEGFNVFATTYATFASARSADAVRVNMGYMEIGVKLVGLGAGFSVGLLGATHMATEDVAIMRSIPNITVISPADCAETVKAVLALANHAGPAYLRLGGGVPHSIVYRGDYEFEIGKSVLLRDGRDVAIVASGPVVANAVQAAELLEAVGISCQVINMHTIKPIDGDALNRIRDQFSMVVSVEEHTVIGGLGSAIAEYFAPYRDRPAHILLGIEDTYPHAGSYSHLVNENSLSAKQIADRIQQEWKRV